MFIKQMTRLLSRASAAVAPASMEIALTPPSMAICCCRPMVARVTLSVPSPRGMEFKPSMTCSTISGSTYSQKAMPYSVD